jgi:hypothetical protein
VSPRQIVVYNEIAACHSLRNAAPKNLGEFYARIPNALGPSIIDVAQLEILGR